MTMSVTSGRSETLGPAHRRWLLVNAILIPLVVNAVSSGFIAWLTSLGEKTVPLMSIPLVQKPSTMTDTLGTFFILPFLTGILVSLAVRRDQRAGRLSGLEPSPTLPRVLSRLPGSRARRASVFGLLCLGLLGPFAALSLVLAGFGGITQSSFVLYKVVLGAGLGLVVTPVIALVAMADFRR